ncbi:MAG: flavodoxin family protein [Alphaproteobacteria bacterium]|nr:flavodoxin family protein [Alphaproteobacteria bacterium]
MAKIAVVYHSGFGHTKAVAEAVARGAGEVAGTEVSLISVEEYSERAAELDAADGIVFGAPTYMGSASAQFKTFMDATGKTWYQQIWKDKLAAGFTCSASQSGDKLSTLQQLATFAMQHGMIWVSLGLLPGNNHSKGSINDLNRLGSFLGAMVQANNDQGAEGIPTSDLDTAAHLGRRIAGLAAKR